MMTLQRRDVKQHFAYSGTPKHPNTSGYINDIGSQSHNGLTFRSSACFGGGFGFDSIFEEELSQVHAYNHRCSSQG